jgi:hypothetical protein
VIAASRETVAERDEVRRAFDENFEWTKVDSDRVASHELTSCLRISGLAIKDRDLAKHMKKWGFGAPKQLRIEGEVKQGYVGVKRKASDDLRVDATGFLPEN